MFFRLVSDMSPLYRLCKGSLFTRLVEVLLMGVGGGGGGHLEFNGAADPLVGEGQRGRHEEEVEEEHGHPHH